MRLTRFRFYGRCETWQLYEYIPSRTMLLAFPSSRHQVENHLIRFLCFEFPVQHRRAHHANNVHTKYGFQWWTKRSYDSKLVSVAPSTICVRVKDSTGHRRCETERSEQDVWERIECVSIKCKADDTQSSARGMTATANATGNCNNNGISSSWAPVSPRCAYWRVRSQRNYTEYWIWIPHTYGRMRCKCTRVFIAHESGSPLLTENHRIQCT